LMWKEYCLEHGKGSELLDNQQRASRDDAKKNIFLLMLNALRISAHKLQIEIGRYQGTLRESRICCRCTSGQVEDEIHYLLR
jgi:hypothetical protein